MMRIFTFLMPLALTPCLLQAQAAPLNHRYTLDFQNTIFTSIHPTDSCFYVQGVMRDSSSNNGSFLTKIDLDGDIKWISEILDTNAYEMSAWWTDIIPVDNKFYIFGFSTYPDNKSFTFIAVINDKGEPLQLKQIEYTDPRSLIVSANIRCINGDFVVAGHNYYGNSDFFILRIDSLLNSKDFDVITNDPKEDLVFSVIEDKTTGNVLVGGIRTNEGSPGIQNMFYHQKEIVAVDSSGTALWSYISPYQGAFGDFYIMDMLLLPDGSVVAATGKKWEEIYSSGNPYIGYYNSVFKLNADHNPVWETLLGNSHYSSRNRLDKIAWANDSTGFIAAGSMFDLSYPPDYDFVMNGVIAKVSLNGDSLWMRRINYPAESGDRESYVYDLKPLPEGGYVMVGETRIETEGAPNQRGWLVTVDDYGCLVPGCQLVSAAAEPSVEKPVVMLFPNPIKDVLQVYYRGHVDLDKSVLFRIMDANGRVLKSWQPGSNEETMVVFTDFLPAGSYFLQCLDGNSRVLNVEPFVKLK